MQCWRRDLNTSHDVYRMIAESSDVHTVLLKHLLHAMLAKDSSMQHT